MKTEYLFFGLVAIIVVISAAVWINRSSSARSLTGADAVLTPTMSVEKEPQSSMTIAQNIVEVAAADSRFSTLVTAVQQAGLVETLSGEGPFTVFAPTNDAFAKLPAETLKAVLADKAQLTAILTYHVVPGKVMAADVTKLTTAKTVQGGQLKVEVTGSEVMINNAKVILTDVPASNGVIHAIDTVLIPQ